jgi:hypothetical protein
MKFNRIFVSLYPYQPFLHFAAGGIERSRAVPWFGFHYPITDDMIGRELFGDEPEFWNPDLPIGADYHELVEAGQRHVRSVMSYAASRGMEVVVNAELTDFPPEFAPLLPDAQTVRQLGEMSIVPGPETSIDDPGLTELATAVLRATVQAYPQAGYIALGTPEFRQWTGQHEAAWQALDRRYGLEKVMTLESLLARARARTDYPGGAERAVQEVQGDIVILYYYDRLLRDVRALEGTGREDISIILNSVSEELFPILPRILPERSELLNFVDYTPSRIVRRREVLSQLPARELPTNLIYTLHDDNIGVLPQLMTAPLHELTLDLRRHGWAGFSTRYWMISDHDLCVAYLSRAAWEVDTTPEGIYRDYLAAACGEEAVAPMLEALDELERVTELLEWHALGLAFPVPDMMMTNWHPGEIPAELLEVRNGYQRAWRAAVRALETAPELQRAYPRYWVGRLRFGMRYIDAVDAVHRAATAEAAGDAKDALRYTEAALAAATEALEELAAVARNRSDLGAIATMAEYVYRPLRDKAAELRE